MILLVLLMVKRPDYFHVGAAEKGVLVPSFFFFLDMLIFWSVEINILVDDIIMFYVLISIPMKRPAEQKFKVYCNSHQILYEKMFVNHCQFLRLIFPQGNHQPSF